MYPVAVQLPLFRTAPVMEPGSGYRIGRTQAQHCRPQIGKARLQSKAVAADLRKLDPEHELSDRENEILTQRMDDFFKKPRRKRAAQGNGGGGAAEKLNGPDSHK